MIGGSARVVSADQQIEIRAPLGLARGVHASPRAQGNRYIRAGIPSAQLALNSAPTGPPAAAAQFNNGAVAPVKQFTMSERSLRWLHCLRSP